MSTPISLPRCTSTGILGRSGESADDGRKTRPIDGSACARVSQNARGRWAAPTPYRRLGDGEDTKILAAGSYASEPPLVLGIEDLRQQVVALEYGVDGWSQPKPSKQVGGTVQLVPCSPRQRVGGEILTNATPLDTHGKRHRVHALLELQDGSANEPCACSYLQRTTSTAAWSNRRHARRIDSGSATR